MKVCDLIAHLATLPQDMEVVSLWDTGGTYHKLREMPRVIDLAISDSPLSEGANWVKEDEMYETNETKRAVVI